MRQTAGIHPTARLSFLPFSTAQFRHLKGLHGNHMTYARLFLADLLPEVDRLLYLDSDLLVNGSLDALQEVDLSGHTLGAVFGSTIEWSLEKGFLTEMGLSPDDPYFNAGVLLLNLARWREEKLTERCMTFLETYPDRCVLNDQTVLNAIFSRQHFALPARFNLPCYAADPRLRGEVPEGILHFVGAPKPWDFGGRQIHAGGRHFHELLGRTAYARFSGPPPFSLRRTLRLSRSYLRAIRSRLGG